MLVDYKIHFIYNKNSNMLAWWRRKRDLILINFKVNKKIKNVIFKDIPSWSGTNCKWESLDVCK